MPVRHGGYLGQMGDADHLPLSADISHFFRNFLCRSSADSCINLIKNQSLYLILICQKGFYCQHDSGELPAGHYFIKGFSRFSGIHCNHKFHLIGPICSTRLLSKLNGKIHIKKV